MGAKDLRSDYFTKQGKELVIKVKFVCAAGALSCAKQGDD